MISRTFKLCLNAGTGSAPYINVSQYDEGETWLFELYSETGERYIPTTGAIVGVKSDGHGIVNTGTVDSEGRVVITETQQMTASAGRAIYELSIDGMTHGTANFIVAVERKPTDEAVMSDSDLSLIQEAIDSAEVIVEVIGDGDPSEVIGEHVDAWLDNHPEATTTVQDGAITAPKINQSLWDKLLVNEEASGVVASFDDGADDVPVSSLKVALEPVQTGTGDPSPTNIRPIIAANGRNLFKLNASDVTSTDGGITIAYNAQRDEYTISGTNTNTSAHLVINRAPLVIPSFVVGETYCVSLTKPTGGMYYLNLTYKTASDVIKGFTVSAIETNKSWRFTVPSDFSTFYHFQIGVYGTTTTIPTTVFGVQIEKDSAPSAYQPYQGIMVDVQSGNLAHLIDETRTGQGITSTVASEKITATGTATSTYANLNYLHPINIVNGQTYTVMLSKAISNAIVFRFATDTSDSTYQQVTINAGSTKATFTASNNFALFRVYIGNLTSGTAVNISDLQILVGNGDISAFVPYSLTSYPYTLGQNVYGGTVDLATGVLTVTHDIVDMGTLTWYLDANRPGVFYSPSLQSTCKKGGYIIADIYKNRSASVPSASQLASADNSISLYPSYGSGYIYAINTSCAEMTMEEFKSAMSGFLCCYELGTPQTIQLTPQEVKTLLGYNNISSTGTVDVIYHADTKLYVDKMTNVDNAIIAPTEADFVATRNYTVNDLVIVADTLYKVTANIANGGTITPNSNVQQTTLSALIKALS